MPIYYYCCSCGFEEIDLDECNKLRFIMNTPSGSWFECPNCKKANTAEFDDYGD